MDQEPIVPGAALEVDQLEALSRITTNDVLRALGVSDQYRGRRLLELLCRVAVRRFATTMAIYDHLVGELDLQHAATWAFEQLAGRLDVAGQHRVPTEGPLLVVANHPGLSDTLALLASLQRDDLRIVAAEWPFFRALPETSRHLIYLSGGLDRRLTAARQVVAHLRQGGAVLAFPRGTIEPDPVLDPGAVRSLLGWSASIGLFLRRAPDTRVLPVIVSGVLSAAARRHPITHIRRQKSDREHLGAVLQIVLPAYQAVTVRVAFGQVLTTSDFPGPSPQRQAVSCAVVEQARWLIERPPDRWETLIPRRAHEAVKP